MASLVVVDRHRTPLRESGLLSNCCILLQRKGGIPSHHRYTLRVDCSVGDDKPFDRASMLPLPRSGIFSTTVSRHERSSRQQNRKGLGIAGTTIAMQAYAALVSQTGKPLPSISLAPASNDRLREGELFRYCAATSSPHPRDELIISRLHNWEGVRLYTRKSALSSSTSSSQPQPPTPMIRGLGLRYSRLGKSDAALGQTFVPSALLFSDLVARKVQSTGAQEYRNTGP